MFFIDYWHHFVFKDLFIAIENSSHSTRSRAQGILFQMLPRVVCCAFCMLSHHCPTPLNGPSVAEDIFESALVTMLILINEQGKKHRFFPKHQPLTLAQTDLPRLVHVNQLLPVPWRLHLHGVFIAPRSFQQRTFITCGEQLCWQRVTHFSPKLYPE